MQERREYFRIVDEVSLNYRVVQNESVDSEIKKAQHEYSELSDLKQALHCINARLDDIEEQLARSNPLVADMLTLINKKIAIHERLSGFEEYNDYILNAAREVNLSASGIAFAAETPITEGTYIKMEIVTYPDHHYIPVYASVVSCKKTSDSGSSRYRIAAKYEVISREDQERLVNHIFKKQTEQLKMQRITNEQNMTGTEDK